MQILNDIANDPAGKKFEVSTIACQNHESPMAIWFEDLNIWPFETMVFAENTRVGLYHAPYATEQEARDGHSLIIEAIRLGSEWPGGVEGAHGTPSIKPEEWRSRAGVSSGTAQGA